MTEAFMSEECSKIGNNDTGVDTNESLPQFEDAHVCNRFIAEARIERERPDKA